jgi:hypothetical protein
MPIIETLADVTRRARETADRAQRSALNARQLVELSRKVLRTILKRSRGTLALKVYPFCTSNSTLNPALDEACL